LRREISCEQRFNLALDIIRELEPVGTEKLDAIIFEKIMRGGNHNAQIATQGASEHGNRGSGYGTKQHHIHAHRGETCDHGIFDHITAEARILADDDTMTMVAALENDTCRLPDLERKLGRDEPIGAPANAVCAEKLPAHGL